MTSTPVPKQPEPRTGRDSSGIALFMVIAAMSVLAVLTTEFTYIAQVNQSLAFDALDRLQAHYQAKSGLKLSLLRLKAYQRVKGILTQMTGGSQAQGSSPIPNSVLDKIWSFPFFYPIPTNIPGMTMTDKDQIGKFQKESGFVGNFSAVIESESSKYNLNLLLAPYASASASPTPTTTPSQSPSTTPSAAPSFDPQAARDSLEDYLNSLFQNKFQNDHDFADNYRDLKMPDLIANIAAWVDRTYDYRGNPSGEEYFPKQAPFFSLTELHMIPPMDDGLYNLFAPALTVSTTPGINVNTMNESTFRALIPGISDEMVSDFFKFRDAQDQDNTFKKEDDFYTYLLAHIFQNKQADLDAFKTKLQTRNIRIVLEESEFKITVQSQVNHATRIIEAWVTLKPASSTPGTSGTAQGSAQPAGTKTPTPGPSGNPDNSTPDAGLKITFMRIL